MGGRSNWCGGLRSSKGALGLLAGLAVSNLGVAHGESGWTLPDGAHVLYGGLGANTFSQLQFADDVEGQQTIDRGLRTRVDLFGATGLTDRLQLSAYVPVVHAQVLDTEGRGPCPDGVGTSTEVDYCDPFTTVGAPAVQARYAAVTDPLRLVAGFAVAGDPWNASKRGRYVGYGDAVVDLQPSLIVARSWTLGATEVGLLGRGAYTWRFSRLIEDSPAGSFRAPADDLRWLAEVHLAPPGPVSIELGLHGLERLWGLDWDGSYQAAHFPTVDRWTTLYYKHVAAGAKVSVALSETMGLHLGASRVISVRNGPPDTLDFSVGVHRYFPASG